MRGGQGQGAPAAPSSESGARELQQVSLHTTPALNPLPPSPLASLPSTRPTTLNAHTSNLSLPLRMARRGIPADPPSLSPAQFYTGQASTPTRIRGRAGEAGERGRLGSQTEVVGSWGGSAGTDGNAVAGPSRERVASVGAGSAKRRARVGRSEPSRTKAGHADGGHTMADLKARKLAISRQIGKKWTGPISGPYIATLLGPDQTRADGKRYLSAVR